MLSVLELEDYKLSKAKRSNNSTLVLSVGILQSINIF